MQSQTIFNERFYFPSCRKKISSHYYFSAKIEIEFAGMLTGRRDVERRQDNLDRVCQFYTVYHSFSVYHYTLSCSH